MAHTRHTPEPAPHHIAPPHAAAPRLAPHRCRDEVYLKYHTQGPHVGSACRVGSRCGEQRAIRCGSSGHAMGGGVRDEGSIHLCLGTPDSTAIALATQTYYGHRAHSTCFGDTHVGARWTMRPFRQPIGEPHDSAEELPFLATPLCKRQGLFQHIADRWLHHTPAGDCKRPPLLLLARTAAAPL